MQLMDRLAATGLLKHQGYVDGAWEGADQGRTYAVADPATGAEHGQVAGAVMRRAERWLPPRRPGRRGAK